MSRVFALLNGKDISAEAVRAWAASADHLYAADGAANTCIAMGLSPIVVGDMDSLVGSIEGLDVRASSDQETTDTEKLLAALARDGHTEVTIGGIEGDRPDHILASLSAVKASEISVTMLLRTGLARIIRSGGSVSLHVPPHTLFSLIPWPEACVTLTGAKWPLQKEVLVIGGKVGISNRSTNQPRIQVDTGTVYLYVEQESQAWHNPWATAERNSG